MPNDKPADPLYRSSLRELRWIVSIWLVTFVWVIGYCRLFGYNGDQPVELTLGMPSWVFWGIVIPWIVATVVSCWFALTQMQDHPLEDASPDEESETVDA